jgi:hypothetical protein
MRHTFGLIDLETFMESITPSSVSPDLGTVEVPSLPAELSALAELLMPIWVRQLKEANHQIIESVGKLTQAITVIDGEVSNLLNRLPNSKTGVVDEPHLTNDEAVLATRALLSAVRRVMFDFQFQDRVSQTLDHIWSNIQVTADALDQQAALEYAQFLYAQTLDVKKLMVDLETRYTSEIERILHRGEKPPPFKVKHHFDAVTLF